MHQDLLQLQARQNSLNDQKRKSPDRDTSKSSLIDVLGHVDQKLPIFRKSFEPYPFFGQKWCKQPLNQKPTLSKQSSHEKRYFKLEGYLRHATLPRVDNSRKRKTEQKKNWLLCHTLEKFDWVKTKIKKLKFKKKMKKTKNCNLFPLQELFFSLGNYIWDQKWPSFIIPSLI